jgi:hypothetical protein
MPQALELLHYLVSLAGWPVPHVVFGLCMCVLLSAIVIYTVARLGLRLWHEWNVERVHAAEASKAEAMARVAHAKARTAERTTEPLDRSRTAVAISPLSDDQRTTGR